MQRLPLRAAGDHRLRCAGIHLRRRRGEAQAGKASGAGAVTCSSCKPMTDAVTVLRVGVDDVDAHDLLAADGEGGGGGRGEEAGGDVQQHVERQARGGADALR